MSTTQRKRRMVPPQQSRRARRQRRSVEPAEPEAEIVETGAEVVDLTCESTEPVVVDLTNNDSVEIVDEDLSSNSQPSSADDQPGRTQSDSCILCSDEEDTRADGSSSVTLTSAAAVPQGNRLHPALCNKDLRLSKVEDLLSRQNVVTFSAASASGTVSKIHTHVQLAERN
ncbi:uncharacterized protein [Chiloscyllium punctatum]|uniref:uncharacterized protein isoform X4 n=1 Tax=Chiloscyllium punctatum TaxID=137246 RepID=UPI003B63F9BD